MGLIFGGRMVFFSVQEIQAALFDNSGLSAHLLKPQLLEQCENTPKVTINGVSIDLADACSILARWDNRYDLNSRGAVLFREWLTRYDYTATQYSGELFADKFDAAKPAITPAELVQNERLIS